MRHAKSFAFCSVRCPFISHEHGGKERVVGEVEEGKYELRGISYEDIGDEVVG